MSQKAVLVRVEGNLIQEVFHSVPDYEDMCQICKDNGWDEVEYTDDVCVEYEWLDIGEGESGTDEFIDDETLLFLYDSYGYEDLIKKEFGLGVEVVEDGREYVSVEDLREDW